MLYLFDKLARSDPLGIQSSLSDRSNRMKLCLLLLILQPGDKDTKRDVSKLCFAILEY